jgi:hypothetical protein
MAEQTFSNPGSRNPSSNADAKPGVVPAPSGAVTLGKDPKNGDGPTAGPNQKGFSTPGIIPGKISI